MEGIRNRPGSCPVWCLREVRTSTGSLLRADSPAALVGRPAPNRGDGREPASLPIDGLTLSWLGQ
jgi:hypothetical protein